MAIPTHHHRDCLGGLAEAHRRSARSYALHRTVQLARDTGAEVPQNDEFMTALCELHSIGEVLALYITPEDSLVVDGLEDPDCDQEEEEG